MVGWYTLGYNSGFNSLSIDNTMTTMNSLQPKVQDEVYKLPHQALEFTCNIYKFVERDSIAHECGNLFSQLCFDQIYDKHLPCPMCQESGMQNVVEYYRARRLVNSLNIKCPFGYN